MHNKQKVQEYINMRNTGQYDMTWFLEHYIENSTDKNCTLESFSRYFNMCDFNVILSHIDNKFGLDRIYDKENRFVRCDFGSNQSYL